MKSPLSVFFSLGDKITKGDPIKQMDWNYYMLWIIFLAFFGVFFGNLKHFIEFQQIANLGWALFGMAIMWFQYNSLKQTYAMRKMMREQAKNKAEGKDVPLEVESVDEMMEGFK